VCKELFYFTEKSFTEYTNNNISAPHVLNGSDLKFTYQAQIDASTHDLNIFLMVNNHSIVSGDMYYIQMKGDQYYFDYSRNWHVELRKCTSLTTHNRFSLPGESAQRWCYVHRVSIFNYGFNSWFLCTGILSFPSGLLVTLCVTSSGCGWRRPPDMEDSCECI
jgi:hypothetical protein